MHNYIQSINQSINQRVLSASSCTHSWTALSTSSMAFPIESTSYIVECLLLQETLAVKSFRSDHVLRVAYAKAVNQCVADMMLHSIT